MTKENLTATAKVGLAEREKFAEGKLDIYKVFWIFMYGSLAGFLIETLWCFYVYRTYMWRSAVLFIPVNAVYGVGALGLHLLLRNIGKNRHLYIFAVGMIGGTVIEYALSYFQEIAFGTRSWDYSHLPLNIGGRVFLVFSVFWGFLALGWVHFFYPWFEKLHSKILIGNYKLFTKIVFVFILILAIASIVAITRWSMRIDGAVAENAVEAWVDRRFPDQLMKFFYPSMKFI